MKKAILKIFPILFISIALLTVSSCTKEKDLEEVFNDSNTIDVTLTIKTEGTLSDSPTFEYRNAKDEIISETLVVGPTIIKIFSVEPGFEIFCKVKGALEGEVEMEAKAKKNEEEIFKATKRKRIEGMVSPFELEISQKL